MSANATWQPDQSGEVLRERARTLGLWGVRVGAGEDAQVPSVHTLSDDHTRIVEQWAASPFVASLLRGAATDWDQEDVPAPRPLFPGCWAIPIVQTERRRRTGYLVFIAMEPRALRAEQHAAACQSARLDREAVTEIMRPFAWHDEKEIISIARMLVWAHQDREEIERSESAVCDFSTQLAESYEELSLLYKLGQSMGELVNPQGFIRFLCEELFATIQYAWFGAWISPACGERAGIARRCFLVGEAPAEAGALRDLLDRKGPEWLAAGPKILAASDIGVRARNPKSPVLAHPLMRAGEVVGALLAGSKLDGDEISSVDMKLLDAAGANLRIFLENTALYAEQRSMFVGTLHALTAAIDAKDSYTSGHSERVAHLSRLLAEAIGLDAEQVERIEIAGLVHDIGKIGVPERVLCKSGRLTDEEFELIKLHPRIGRNILKDIPQMTDLLPAVLSHHERWDGRGYPEGLIREQIPLHARIVALADSFDAMSSTRTYRAAMQRAAVLREIERCAGSQFDPDLAPVFVTLDFSRYDEMVRKHLRSDGRLSSMGDAA